MNKLDTKPRNILVVKNRALGDAILGLSSISYIKKLFCESHITYAVPKWVMPLFNNLESDADRIIPLEFKTFGDWCRTFKACKEYSFDIIIELHQSGRSGTFFSLFSKVFNIPYFFHNHNHNHNHIKGGSGSVLDQGITKPTIQRDLDGVWSGVHRQYKVVADIPNYLNYQPWVRLSDEQNENLKQKVVVLGVVATRKTKQWPLRSYHKLCQLLLDSNKVTEIIIPISTSREDLELEGKFNSFSPQLPVTFIKKSLAQLPIEVHRASVYIGNDTGIKHLAVALGLRTYTFFGPEDPLEWHPYNKILHPYFYVPNLECRTRETHFCGLQVCDSMICLNQFSPEAIFAQIEFP